MNLVKPLAPINPETDLRGVDTTGWSAYFRIDQYPYCQIEPGVYHQHVVISMDNQAVDVGWDEENEYCHCLEAAAAQLRDVIDELEAMVA